VSIHWLGFLMVASEKSASTRSWAKISHYLLVGLLLTGGMAYWLLKPATLNPMADPMAAEALALVQTHQARSGATLMQSISERVKTLRERGQGVRLGEWTVQREQESTYLVRIWMREQATKGWFELDYLWKVDVMRKTVVPLTMAAADLMPAGSKGLDAVSRPASAL
jgi:hypothetical protein